MGCARFVAREAFAAGFASVGPRHGVAVSQAISRQVSRATAILLRERRLRARAATPWRGPTSSDIQ
jgi:hypothetical protein